MYSCARFENDSGAMESAQILLKAQEIQKNLADLSLQTGYRIRYANNNSQRIFGPPWNHPEPPSHGTEVFVSRLPKDACENELLSFFTRVGRIYMIRLMVTPSQIHNKGFAFVTYFTREEAHQCIRLLPNIEFRKGCYLGMEKSLDNSRIFIGGIPELKTKDQVWQELVKTGMMGITDVIMYRSYTDRSKNRGFVFVEFKTHQEAAQMRVQFKNMLLWGNRVHVDWSSPLPEVEPRIMSQVKKLFLRNLDVTQSKMALQKIIENVLGGISLERVYKFKDYAFVHFITRRDAQRALEVLKELFRNSDVEVMWAIPPKYKPRQRHRTGRNFNSVSSQKEEPCEVDARTATTTLEDAFRVAGILAAHNLEESFCNEDNLENDNIVKMMRQLGLAD